MRPAAFGFNQQTADSNRFQQPARDPSRVHQRALDEFDQFSLRLRQSGIKVLVGDDTAPPNRPDAVFPGNWFSSHADGRLVIYPMAATSRRLERRPEYLQEILVNQGYSVREIIDLSEFERRGQFLEGTGSLVLDRDNHLAFACHSERTHPEALAEFCRQLGYEAVEFTACDESGSRIYHTDVMMCIGKEFVLIADGAISDSAVRGKVLELLSDGGRELISLSMSQLRSFSGNMLNMLSTTGESRIVLSERAFDGLNSGQKNALEAHGQLLTEPLPTIEEVGGGSARCMIAEIFLPRVDQPDCVTDDRQG